MRGFWITLGPMLAVAALALWGGERLARRVVENRTPADRDRVFDFAESLRGELDRLNAVYAGHLNELAENSRILENGMLARRCENLVGVRALHVFESLRKTAEVSGKKPGVGSAGRIPEVVSEEESGRLVSRNTVVMPLEILDGRDIASGWLPSPDPDHRVRWIRTGTALAVAFVIDDAELRDRLEPHLAAWQTNPLAPLREAGERFAILGPGGREWLASEEESRTGPAAMVLPHRTGLGEWQVLAWDTLETATTHDTATLALAAGISAVLVVTGAFLFVQQRRALRLAEERVSFVNRVSHELGSPLTNILLNLDLAAGSIRERPAESGRRLALVNEEVQRLARLVSNVLTFSRGENKTLELNPAACVPDQVIEGVLAQFQPSLDRRKVRVEWDRAAGASTRLDPDALAQIVGNLISNVEKYASGGGKLGIESGMENGRLRVRVSDRGPGIPARQRQRVFEAFERVHRGVSEGASGTGLGLAIARDLARRMRGDLVLVPTPAGATFEIDIPAPGHLSVVANEDVA